MSRSSKKGPYLDANILEGIYFEQFYFLDKDWITEQVKQHYKSEEREWLAFIGGFTFGNPPVCIDIMTKVLGLEFDNCYTIATEFEDDGLKVRTIHLNDLITAKTKSNRPKDIDDINNLRKL